MKQTHLPDALHESEYWDKYVIHVAVHAVEKSGPTDSFCKDHFFGIAFVDFTKWKQNVFPKLIPSVNYK